MSRLLLPLSVALAVASAIWLYTVKHETRALEARIQADERSTEKVRSEISVLKAERAHLARPERIDPAARALGLGPPSAGQLVRTDPLPAGQSPTGAVAGGAEGRGR